MEPTLEQRSKHALLLERIKTKYPDLDTDNEDLVAERIGTDFDDYEETKRHEAELSGFLASDPRAADFLMNWRKGENPVTLLIRTFGDDFRDALDDPEMADKLVEARKEYLARHVKNDELEAQARANLAESLANLDNVAASEGYSEEEKDEAFNAFSSILDDGIVNKISPETWLMVFRAIRYDQDVSAAAHEGEVRGRNTRIDSEKKKTTMPDGLPPALGGSGVPVTPAEKPSLGALDRAAEVSIFDRGNPRRTKRN